MKLREAARLVKGEGKYVDYFSPKSCSYGNTQEPVPAVSSLPVQHVGLDEADHIPEIGKVVSTLTVARGIFFVSDREIFVIAASSDLVRKSDVARGVFDSMVSLKPLSSDDLSRILDKRVRLENQSQSIEKIFEPAAISDIHYFSKGLPKDALRLAANSLTEAAIRRKNTVSREEVKAAWKRSTSKITDILEGNELAVFQALEKLGRAYSSTHELQAATRLSRSQLNRILKTLYEREYVRRALVNRAFEYYI